MPDSFTFRSFVRSVLVICGLGLFLLYVAYQARFLIIGPQITLYNEPATRQNTRSIELTGSATNISRLWLNGRAIFTDPQGDFTAAVILENGYTNTTLTAEDRYGRTTTITRSFVYSPSSFIN